MRTRRRSGTRVRSRSTTRPSSIARSMRRSSWTGWRRVPNTRASSARRGARGIAPDRRGRPWRAAESTSKSLRVPVSRRGGARDQRRDTDSTPVCRGVGGACVYSAFARPAARSSVSIAWSRGTDDRDPHRVVLRTVWHPIHLRERQQEAWPPRQGAHAQQGPAELRPLRRVHAVRGIRGCPERRHAVGIADQLDAFHRTFNFCMSCRQYTCENCWNEPEGRCLSCAPNLGTEILPAAFPDLEPYVAEYPTNGHLEAVEPETNGHVADELAWPEIDLPSTRIARALGDDEAELLAAEAVGGDRRPGRADRCQRDPEVESPDAGDAIARDRGRRGDRSGRRRGAVADRRPGPARRDRDEPSSPSPSRRSQRRTSPPSSTGSDALAEIAAVEAEAGVETIVEPAAASVEPEAVDVTPVAASEPAAAEIADVEAESDAPVIVPRIVPRSAASRSAVPEERAAAAAAQTSALLAKFRPGQSLDDAIAAYEAELAKARGVEAADLDVPAEVPTELRPTADEPVDAARRDPLAVEPEPMIAEGLAAAAIVAEVVEPETPVVEVEAAAEVVEAETPPTPRRTCRRRDLLRHRAGGAPRPETVEPELVSRRPRRSPSRHRSRSPGSPSPSRWWPRSSRSPWSRSRPSPSRCRSRQRSWPRRSSPPTQPEAALPTPTPTTRRRGSPPSPPQPPSRRRRPPSRTEPVKPAPKPQPVAAEPAPAPAAPKVDIVEQPAWRIVAPEAPTEAPAPAPWPVAPTPAPNGQPQFPQATADPQWPAPQQNGPRSGRAAGLYVHRGPLSRRSAASAVAPWSAESMPSGPPRIRRSSPSRPRPAPRSLRAGAAACR